MAIYIKNQPRDIGGQIGLGFGGGASLGIESSIQKREQAQKAKRIQKLLQDIEDAPTKQDALKMASDPSNTGLFTSLQDTMIFGKLVNSIWDKKTAAGAPKSEPITIHQPDGSDKEISVMLTGEQRTKIASSPDQNSALLETLGQTVPKGSTVSLGHQTGNQQNEVIYDEKSGNPIRVIPRRDFDPSKLKAGETTETGLKNKWNMDRNARSAQAKKGKDSDSVRRVKGNLEREGIEASDENINKELGVEDSINRWTPRLAATFGMYAKDGDMIEKIQGSGGAERYQAAQTVMPRLMRAGMSDQDAFNAATNLGQAIKANTSDPLTGDVKKKSGKYSVKTLDKNNVSKLTDRDIGQIFKTPDGQLVTVAKDKKTGKYHIIETGVSDQ